jgi:hypothetical protein
MRLLTRVRGGWWSSGASEDAWDVEGQGAVGVDRFVLAGAEVRDRFVADGVPVGSLSVDGVLEVAGGREDAGVDDEGVAVRLGCLVFVVGVADGAAVGEEDEAA